MNEILAVMEGRKRGVLVRAWQWPEPMEVFRAYLTTSPSHPRAPMELLEAVARWQGRRVHAALVVGRPDGSCLNRLFSDLFEPEPTAQVEVSFVEHRPYGARVGCAPPNPSTRSVPRAEMSFAVGVGDDR